MNTQNANQLDTNTMNEEKQSIHSCCTGSFQSGGGFFEIHVRGHLDMAAFRGGFGLRQPTAFAALDRVALQFDVEPPRKDRRQSLQQRAGLGGLPGAQEPPHRAIRPAGEADQPLGMGGKIVNRHMRQLAIAAQIQTGVQLHQVHVAGFGLGQGNDGRSPKPAT